MMFCCYKDVIITLSLRHVLREYYGNLSKDNLQYINQIAVPMNYPWQGVFISKIFHGYISVTRS